MARPRPNCTTKRNDRVVATTMTRPLAQILASMISVGVSHLQSAEILKDVKQGMARFVHRLSIDETNIAYLLHPFFTPKADEMGLGLALSRSITAAHGGWIWATRNPDRRLTVSFPRPAV